MCDCPSCGVLKAVHSLAQLVGTREHEGDRQPFVARTTKQLFAVRWAEFEWKQFDWKPLYPATRALVVTAVTDW